MNKYYCSQKFWWLSVDLQKMETMSCCAATPNKIDHKWLKANPGEIFNTEKLKEERTQMLQGKKVEGCSATCWRAEEAGLSSRRTMMNSDKLTHKDVHAKPEMLHLVLGNQCNMTCSYCCKQYSSAWLQDLEKNGTYKINSTDDRFEINLKDKIFKNIGQKQLSNRDVVNFTIKELQKTLKNKKLSSLEITGGEPFLYVGLDKILEKFDECNNIGIYSGLGVNPVRFESEISKLRKYKDKITLTVSAENTEEFYEFNRAGNTWKRFKENIDCLKKFGIKYKFHSVLSNLTLFGLQKFEEFAKGYEINYQPCNDPDFLGMNVLDQDTKEYLKIKLFKNNHNANKIIMEALDKEPTQQQHDNFSIYIKEFARRRNKVLSIFPKSLLEWINH